MSDSSSDVDDFIAPEDEADGGDEVAALRRAEREAGGDEEEAEQEAEPQQRPRRACAERAYKRIRAVVREEENSYDAESDDSSEEADDDDDEARARRGTSFCRTCETWRPLTSFGKNIRIEQCRWCDDRPDARRFEPMVAAQVLRGLLPPDESECEEDECDSLASRAADDYARVMVAGRVVPDDDPTYEGTDDFDAELAQARRSAHITLVHKRRRAARERRGRR
jgi:hypothetical protein